MYLLLIWVVIVLACIVINSYIHRNDPREQSPWYIDIESQEVDAHEN